MLALQKSLQSLKSATFSTTSYAKKRANPGKQEMKYDTSVYDQKTGLDRTEAFHIAAEFEKHNRQMMRFQDILNPGPQHRRAKRAIFNFIGEALSFIAGTPSPTQYQMLSKQAEKQKIALLKGEHMTAEMEDEIQVLSNEAKQEAFDNSKINEELIRLQMNDKSLETFFKESILLFYVFTDTLSAIDQAMREISSLKIGLAEAYRGYLSREIVNIDDLKLLAGEINSKVRKTTIAFPIERIELMYGIKTTTVHREKGTIHIFTRVPLIDVTHAAKLIHLSPVTKMEIGNRADFILTSGGTYQEMTYQDLSKSLFIEDFGYITAKRLTETSPNADQEKEEFMKGNWVQESLSNHFVIMAEQEFHASVVCGEDNQEHPLSLSRLSYVFLPDRCELRSNWLQIQKNQQVGIKDLHYNETALYEDIWKNLKDEEAEFKRMDEKYIPTNISTFHAHHFSSELPLPLRAARSERKNTQLEADLASFRHETRLEVGFLFGILLLLLLALGALFAFWQRRRVLRSQSHELQQTNPTLAEEIAELKEGARAHQSVIAEELEKLKRSTGSLTTVIEGAIARESMERESIQKALDLLKKQVEEGEKKTDKLESLLHEAKEENARLKDELVKVENIRMGLA